MGRSSSAARLGGMSKSHGVKQRVAIRDALTARTRKLTTAALAVSAVLSGTFAGIAAASAPGHKLQSGTTAQQASNGKRSRSIASTHTSTAIPPLPAAPGPGNLSAPAPPAPTAGSAPTQAQAPPVVVSGGS